MKLVSVSLNYGHLETREKTSAVLDESSPQGPTEHAMHAIHVYGDTKTSLGTHTIIPGLYELS